MKKKFTWMHLLILVVFSCSALFLSPTVSSDNLLDELLDKHAEAMGGKEKWTSLKTLIIRLDTGDGGVMEAFTKKPDKFKLIMRFTKYEWIKGYDGKTGWSRYNGVEEPMNAGEAKEMAEEPDFFDELLLARERGYAIQLLTREKLEGRTVYKIQLTKASDDVVTYYLNATTYLIERIDETSHDPKWKGMAFSTVLQDYQNWDGLMIPRRWGITGGPYAKPRWMEVEDVIVNSPLEDGIFQP